MGSFRAMAGIGLKLNKIFEKKTISAYLAGFAYSSMSTVTPMLVVILNQECGKKKSCHQREQHALPDAPTHDKP